MSSLPSSNLRLVSCGWCRPYASVWTHAILLPCYLATSVPNGVEEQSTDAASYNDHWYAVAYPWQIEDGEVFSTRLWGEPMVIYRDAEGNLVCSKDVCPHRSAPLSMGKMNADGQLECM